MDADPPAAPDPAAVPPLPCRPLAYTDLERVGTLAADDVVTVHDARVDGTAVALAEVRGRDDLSGRATVEAVDTWRSVADLDGAASVVDAGKKPLPWVAAERPPRPLGSGGPRDLDHALWVGAHLAEALAAAHDRAVVHGALTPTTVREWPAPAPDAWPLPRVLDWGLADARHRVDATDSVAVVGTGGGGDDDDGATLPPAAAFLAPERLAGAAPTPVADVYGVGALLYWLLTGETAHGEDPRPGVAVPPSTVAPGLPRSVDGPVRAALAVDPDHRPTAATLRDDLRDLLGVETGTGTGTGTDTPDATSRASTGAGTTEDLPRAFPLFDGSRAEWRAPCPDCGRSVNNTASSFVDHWVDADRCDGPPVTPPSTLTGLTDPEYAHVVDAVERLRRERDPDGGGLGDHPLLSALADPDRTVRAVGGVDVQRGDGGFPWLERPGRGWRVPCPDCGDSVFNALSAFRSHWADAADCDGPPDGFHTR